MHRLARLLQIAALLSPALACLRLVMILNDVAANLN